MTGHPTAHGTTQSAAHPPSDRADDEPLTGVTVVSLAVNLPGPVCAAELAAMGATVTSIVPPSGDPLATYCPSYYAELHRDVIPLTLDLKSPADRHRLDDLLTDADVLLTSSRPRALAGLGLSPEQTSAQFPQLVRVDIVGSLATPDTPGHDLTYQAEAGLLDESTLTMPRTLVADVMGAQRAVAEVVTGLLVRQTSGLGGVRTVGLRESAHALTGPLRHGLTGPYALLGGAHPGYGRYRCADGVVTLAALEPHFLQTLAQVVGVEPDALTADNIQQWCGRQRAADLTALAQRHDLPLVAQTQKTSRTQRQSAIDMCSNGPLGSNPAFK